MRVLNLIGAPNARDLGGMRTALGRIKQGRLIRSGELSRILPADVEILQSIPLTRIVDLRTPPEQEKSPDVEIAGVVHTDVQIIRATTFGITYEKSSGADIAIMLQAGFARMSQRNETYDQHMALLYHKFVEDEFSRTGYGNFLKLLANSPMEGGTLWHCTMGKDRVGTCTALLLHCLGASREQIYQDYLLTNDLTAANRAMILAKVKGHVADSHLGMIDKMLSASATYLDGFFEEIALRYGTVDAFLAECGVTPADIANLRNNYLE